MKNTFRKIEKKSNLEKFLVWELISLHKEQGSGDFEKIVRDLFDKITKKNKQFFFIKYFDCLYNMLHSFSEKRIFFKGDRFKQFISETKKEFPVGMIVSGISDRLYAIKNFIPYISFSPFYKYVDKYFKTGDKKYLKEVTQKMGTLLKKRDIDSIVLWNDCFPLDRALILEARKKNIPTIQIQVGLHISTYQPENGREADFIFVWGDFFRDMYDQYNVRDKKNIYTLGYPREIKKFPSTKKIKRVVYLGQNIEKFNSSLFKTKIDTINQLNQLCKKNKLCFKYRPHPNDDIKSILKEIPKLNLSIGKLEETFKEADILVSFYSTSLVEGAMAGKICIQLTNYPMHAGNFEKLGICKSFTSIKSFEKHLKKIVDNPEVGLSFKFNSYYINQPKEVKKKFVRLLKKVLKKK